MSDTYNASISSMKSKICYIACYAIASLIGFHPKQLSASEFPSPASAVSPERLKQELVAYTWSWVDSRPNLWTEVHFNQDGTLTGWIGSRQVDTRRWEVTGPYTAQMTGPGHDTRMRVFTFDATLTKYVCLIPDPKLGTLTVTGSRLVPVAKSASPAADPSTPKAAAAVPAGPVVNLPPGPIPAPIKPILTPAQLDPIVGRWRLGGSIIVFAQDGSFKNSAPNYFEKGTWSLASSSTTPTYQFNWSDGRKIEEFELSGNELKRLDKRKGWVTAGQRVD